MKISAVNPNVSNLLAFKSLRTDKKEVEFLKIGQGTILENKKINIQTALNSLAENAERHSIEFLLDVADNLAYGQNGQSRFATIIDEETLASTERENTDWHAILKDTVERALKNSKDDTEGLNEEFNRVFANDRELTPLQQEILTLRTNITQQLLSDVNTQTPEDISHVANIRKNLDYFVSSSEISFADRKECLEKFQYILSDDYKINPQLEDKKLQVVDEILNDIIVKTPESDVLTIKDVDQVESGMCGAISVCRKLMAYEEKPQFVNIIIEELSADDEMEVFDITELGTGKKTKLKKINIDYDDAIDRGYRIIDAAAHHWMHNAHQAGNGSVPLETYTAFQKENYGIYNDASWYEGIDETQILQKNLLKALIKQKEFIDAFDKQKNRITKQRVAANTSRRVITDEIAQVNGVLNKTFNSIFDTLPVSEQTKLIKSSMEFYKGVKENNEVNISGKMPKELREKLLVEHIQSKTPNRTEEQNKKLVDNGKKILEYLEEKNKLEQRLSSLKSNKSDAAKYRYNNALFKVAAAHRLAVESDVNQQNSFVKYKNKCKLKSMDEELISYMKEISKSFESENVRALYADEKGNVPTADDLNVQLYADMAYVKDILPAKTDEIITSFYGKDLRDLILDIYDDAEEQIAKNNKEYIKQFSVLFDVPQDKMEVLNAVKNVSAPLRKNPSEENVQKAALAIGHESRMQTAFLIVNSFVTSLQEGITEGALDELKERLNIQNSDEVGTVIGQKVSEFNSLINQYNEIRNKWGMPSSQSIILKKLENQGFVSTRKDLDIIQNRLDVICSKRIENNKIENLKERKTANSKIYKFTEKEEKILKSFDDNFGEMKKYHKSTFKDLLAAMKEDLEDQYSKIGMLNGQFWVGEEGGSGLTSVEEMRIVEQMTGKPYHVEKDVKAAAKEIKKGNGGGIYSSSVEDFDFGFHAQYTPSVTPVNFKNPITGEEIKKDVLWTDNSWGRVEKEKFWNGHDGNYYTDYDRDFGWDTGYIIDKHHKIGHPVDKIFGAVGHSKSYDEDFGLFSNVIIPGTPIKSYIELHKMFDKIFLIGEEGPALYAQLENLIEQGEKVDTKKLVALDDIASAQTEKLRGRLEKEIKSKEDFDKLSDEDPLKILFEKIALHFVTKNEVAREEVASINSFSEIEKMKEGFQEDALTNMAELTCKSEDTLYNMFISASPQIDKVYNEMESLFGLILSEEKRANIAKSIYEDNETAINLKGPLSETTNYLVNRVPVVAVEHFETEEQVRFFIEKMQNLIVNDIEENFKIKSINSPVIENSPMGENFVNAIDKYLQPKSDKEMLKYLQDFQEAEFETVENFLSLLHPEDMDLNFRDAWEYVQLYNADNEDVRSAFYDLAATDVIYSNIKIGRNNTGEELNEYSSMSSDELYRSLHVRLSEMDVQKYIKKFSAEAFQKYRVRQAFPNPAIYTDEDLIKTTDNTLESFAASVDHIECINAIIDALDSIDKFVLKYQDDFLFNSISNKKDFHVLGNEKKLREFYDDLENIKQKLLVDDTFQLMTENIEKLQIVLENSETVVDGRKAFVPMKKLLDVYNDWQSSFLNKQKFMDSKNEKIKELNSHIKLFVEANIEAKYRDNAYTILNELISMYKNDVDEETLLQQEEKIKSLMIDKHITKNPTALLEECVAKCQNGEKDSPVYSVLKAYLITSLQVAMQTKVQYKLVQNQHEGISSKVKQMLSMFNVSYRDGSSKSMETPDGIIYLCHKLKNASDNNLILNLFLQQSGLSSYAVKSIIENFQIEKTNEIIDEKADLVKTYLNDLKLAQEVINGYLSQKHILNRNFESYMKGIVKNLKVKTANVKDSVVIDEIIKTLEQVKITDEGNIIKTSMLPTVVRNIVDSTFDNISIKINEQLDALDYIPTFLIDDMNLIDAITIEEDSEEAKMREEFRCKINDVINYKSMITQEINEIIYKNNFISKNNN